MKVNQGSSWSLYTGIAPMKVVAFNPSAEEIKSLTGREEVADPQYDGLNDDGTKKLRLDIWLRNEENNITTKVVFWLEDRLAVSSSGNKQFVNAVGMSTWAADVPSQDWFIMRDYRHAYVGEADLYNFLSTWLGINKRSKESECVLDTPFSDIVAGNLDELRDLIVIYGQREIKVLLSVREGKYQDVYGKVFIQMESGYTDGLKKTLERDASSGYPYRSNYQGDFTLKKYTGESAPAETLTATPADISALLKNA